MELKTQEQLKKELSAPLPAEAVKDHPTKVGMSSIKPIYITERLNDVFGIGGWTLRADLLTPPSVATKTTNAGKQRTEYTSLVKVVFNIPAYGVHYECIAGSTNDDEGDAVKGGITDGLTKISSWMEIGIDVFKGKVKTGNKQASTPQKPQPSPTKNEPKKEEPKQDNASALKPSASFDKAPELDADKKKAKKAYDALDQSVVLKHLITIEKLTYATVSDFIQGESIERVREIYAKLTSK